MRNSEKESIAALKNLRLSFNFPGTKRALIAYAQNVSKIDGRSALSKEFNSFIDQNNEVHPPFKGAIFYDPIQGIEYPQDYFNSDLPNEDEPGDFEKYLPQKDVSQISKEPQEMTINSQNPPQVQPLIQPQLQYQQQQPFGYNMNQNPHIDLYQDVTPQHLYDSPFNKQYYESPVLRQSDMQPIPMEYMQPQSQQMQYQPAQMSNVRFSQEQYQQIEGQNNMNVLKLSQNRGSKTPMVAQHNQMNNSRGHLSNQGQTPNTVSHAQHYAMMQPIIQQPQQQMFYEPQYYNYPEPVVNRSEANMKFANYFENPNKNIDLTKSLQYKVPINSVQQRDQRMTSSKDNFSQKKSLQNSYNFKSPDDRLRMQNQRGRYRTPNANNRVNFEEPDFIDNQRSKSKKTSNERSRSAKKPTKQLKNEVTEKPKTKNRLKDSTEKISSNTKRSKSKSKKSKGQSEDDEYEYVKVKKNQKAKIIYENDSTSSEDKQPSKKIVIESHKSRIKPKKNSSKKPAVNIPKKRRSRSTKKRTNPRYVDDQEYQYDQVDQDIDYNYAPVDISIKKKNKEVMFHVDINMDSKVVRIAIHEGDNIDRIVQKFDDLFHLKPKQRAVLTDRIKSQYIEMIGEYYEDY